LLQSRFETVAFLSELSEYRGEIGHRRGLYSRVCARVDAALTPCGRGSQ